MQYTLTKAPKNYEGKKIMNKIKLGETIYRLRKSRKITQEQLGEFIGVSKGAISKWESGVSYPDIELLPILARFFDISIDELLNFNISITEEMEENICEECRVEISNGFGEKGIELCKKYINKYTKNYKLKFTLTTLMTVGCAYMKDEEKIKKIYGKAIEVYEDIVNNANDDELVESAKLQLSMYYTVFEDYDKALSILDKMKKSICDVEIMKAKTYIMQENFKEGRKIYQERFLNAIGEVQGILQGLAHSYYKENLELAEKYMSFSMEINKLVEGNLFNGTFDQYLQLSRFYAYYNHKEKCVEAIRDAIESLEVPKIELNKVWYLNELNYETNDCKFMDMNKAMVNLLDMEEYKFLQDDAEFKELKEKMKKAKFNL